MPITKEEIYSYKDHPLYGLRILHFLSPVRWNTAREFEHGSDSNFKLVEKTIKHLPMCHHYIVAPKKHKIPNDRPNVTIWDIEYPTSVLLNRAWIDKQTFTQNLNLRWTDIDIVFNHQPELLYNIYSLFQGKRGGNLLKSFNFFHWVDCDKSRPMEKYPPGFYRQLDAIHTADTSFFHCPVAWKEYLFSNFGEDKLINSLNQDRFVNYTKNIDLDKYFIWLTDEDFNRTGGKSVLPPEYMYIKKLKFKQYLYLLKHVHCTVSFVDQYQTWNLSLQDAIKIGKPTIIYKHPAVENVVGKDYPFYFSNKKEFEKMLDNVPEIFN